MDTFNRNKNMQLTQMSNNHKNMKPHFHYGLKKGNKQDEM